MKWACEKGKHVDKKKEKFLIEKRGLLIQKKKGQQMTKQCHFLAAFFDQKAPQKCRYGVLIKKKGEMMEKRRKKNTIALFSTLCDIIRRGGC